MKSDTKIPKGDWRKNVVHTYPNGCITLLLTFLFLIGLLVLMAYVLAALPGGL